MQIEIGPAEVALRLVLTLIAGAIIGINRVSVAERLVSARPYSCV